MTPTRGEKLRVLRRRRGWSQRAAAKKYKTSEWQYREWEADTNEGAEAPDIELELQLHELCFLTRRREGWTAAEIADDLGVSRYWLGCMERGQAPVDRLAEYWGIK
jgi:transcriptional regulator with XRE-family HTH domain